MEEHANERPEFGWMEEHAKARKLERKDENEDAYGG